MQLNLGRTDGTRQSTARFWFSTRAGASAILDGATLRGILLSCLAGIVFGVALLVSPALGVVLGMGLLVLVASFSTPILLCYLVIAAIILTSGIERGRFFPVLTGNEVTLLGAVGITMALVLADRQRKVAVPKYYWLAFCLLVGGTVFAPVAMFMLQRVQLTLGNAFKMFGVVQYFLLFWLFVVHARSERSRRKIIWWMLAFSVIVAVVGLAQAAGIGPVRQLLERMYSSAHESVAARAGRVTSLMGAWNGLGIFMMTVCFICWAMLSETDQPAHRLVIVGVMALSVLCLVASGSYAGILGLATGLLLIQLLNGQKARVVPVIILGLIAAIPLVIIVYPYLRPLVEHRLTEQFRYGGWMPQTLAYRILVWRQIFIPAIQAHFPWPVYPSVPTYYAWHFEESQYILLLFRTGLVGFVSYLAWIFATIVWLYRRYRRSQGLDKAITSAALSLVVVLVIAGLTNEVFSFSGTIDYLWIMLALAANGREVT